MSQGVLLSKDERGIFLLTLNQPRTRNSLSYQMAQEFERAIGEVKRDEQARCLVLTGSGDAFCAGGDYGSILADFSLPAVELQPRLRKFYSQFLCITELEIPTIAAVNGPAVGAGFSLALACDLRVASTRATFHANFVRIGVHPGMGATYFMSRLLGTARALEILWKAEPIRAEEALSVGIVSKVVDPESLLEEAMGMAARIASLPPRPVQQIKESVYMAVGCSLKQALDRESHAQALCGETQEMRARMRTLGKKGKGDLP
ncbi:MAG: enoyl-CoA hydratase/isomerase family protein [Thermodesulfobacteriota bacterium]